MSYKEAISLKLTNNTSIDQPIGILGVNLLHIKTQTITFW